MSNQRILRAILTARHAPAAAAAGTDPCPVPPGAIVEVVIGERHAELRWPDSRSIGGYRSHRWLDTTVEDPEAWIRHLYKRYVE